MKMVKPKSKNLNKLQSKLWDEVNRCRVGVELIGFEAGISGKSINRWCLGKQKPRLKNGLKVLAAIKKIGYVEQKNDRVN